MADSALLETIRVIDTDTHLTEPPDLWTSRLEKKWLADAPTVQVHPQTNHHHWKVGDTWLAAVGYFAYAGWPEYPPNMPNEYDEIDPGAFSAKDRLERMDEYGIYAHVLYPNLIGFEAPIFMRLGEELALRCTEAYNDYLVEFSSADPKRFIPIAMVPFWDQDASVKEMARCKEMGHKGILFANKYELIGMPSFTDPHWDRIYAAAQDLELSVNFHVGFASQREGAHTADKKIERAKNYNAADSARTTSIGIMGNADSIAAIVTSGLCDR